MAEILSKESFKNAIINSKDQTITEYEDDNVRCYSLKELIERWDGVVGVELTIERHIPLPPDGREEYESKI